MAAGGGAQVKPQKVKIVMRPKSAGGGGGGGDMSQLAELGRKEVNVVKAANAIKNPRKKKQV
jgi:hypothetical protein